MRLVQFESESGRSLGVVDVSGNRLSVVQGAERVYDLALEAARAGQGLVFRSKQRIPNRRI